MDVQGKTKDNVKLRMNVADIYDREELYLQRVPNGKIIKQKAKLVLAEDKRRELSEWVKRLNMLDRYCSNFRNNVDLNESKFNNMKSHDFHVFIETLLPIAFGALPDDVLKLLIELS